MATMNASEVTVGSALATGAIWVAPQATALPTDASTKLATAYKLLGFTSDAGVTISESNSTNEVRAWEGRTVVYTTSTDYTETIAFTPIQCNADVAKLAWGDGNVTVDGGKLAIKHTAATLDPVALVIETVPRKGIVKRYCCKAQLTARGDATLDGTQPDGRQLTFTVIADDNGTLMAEYVATTGGSSS